MRILKSVVALAALSLAACDSLATEPEGPMTGTWKYTAIETFAGRPGAPDQSATCRFESTFVITQIGNEIEGESVEAPIYCTWNNGKTTAKMHSFPAGVVRGEVEGGRVHFSTAGNYRSFGELAPERIEGYLEVYEGFGDIPVQPYRAGSFVLERISHEGFRGPRA